MDPAPLILAIETATSVTSVALLRGDAVVAELERGAGPHAERLLPAIEELLTGASAPLDAVEGVAVAIGPGSFTGLRIGLATAKGLVFGTGRPVAAISTLQALAAAAAPGAAPVVALLDARRGEVYAGRYDRPGDAAESDVGDRVWTPEALADALPERCTLVVGEGAREPAAFVAERRGPGIRLLPALASAARLGRLGARRLAGGVPEAADLVPRYLRRAEAEVRRTGERFEPAR